MMKTSKKTVVLVEDDARLRKELIRLLGVPEDIDCLFAVSSAEEALEKIPEARPDVVLMDINLPGKSGIDCLGELRSKLPDLEIVMIGPMTNLALALALDPQLPRRVAGVTIMGGHVREARLGAFVCPFGIDYNLCSDPEASVAVLGAGFRTTLVTADVTLQTWLRTRDLEGLDEAGPLAREIARQVRFWTPLQRKIFTAMGGALAEDNVAFLHDPLTVLALVDSTSLKFEALQIATTIEAGVLRTHEVDPSLGIGMPMRVATAVDAERARETIVERLLRL